VDSSGHPFEFSIYQRGATKTRAKMAALIQQTLANIALSSMGNATDFPSLIERISRTYQYDACLLGTPTWTSNPNGHEHC